MIPEIVEKIYVINLKSCLDRRKNIEKEFSLLKVSNYEFVEAIDKNDKKVIKSYIDGFVKPYPKCFRCKKIKCNCKNNVLIKNQVANWLSFIKVMKIIIKTDFEKKLFMICEDDIKFKDNAKIILKNFFSKKKIIEACRNFNNPLLIRCEERKSIKNFLNLSNSSNIVMSNAGFIINKEFAKIFLENLNKIDTTSDIYIHKRLAKINNGINHFTIFPGICYQLSDNKNALFESQIHPKGINKADKLRKRNHKMRIKDSHLIAKNKKLKKQIFIKINSHPCAGKSTFIRKNKSNYQNCIFLDFDKFVGDNRSSRIFYNKNFDKRKKFIFLFGSAFEMDKEIGLFDHDDYFYDVLSLSVFIPRNELFRNIEMRKIQKPKHNWTDINKITKLIEISYKNIYVEDKLQSIFTSFKDAVDYVINIYDNS